MCNSDQENPISKREQSGDSLVASGKRLRIGLVFMVASLVGYRLLLFLTKILLANTLTVAGYGLVTYCWSTGTTIGYLLMIGREHDAVVMIPRMNPRELKRTSSYIERTFIVFGLMGLGALLGLSLLLSLDIRIWGVIAFALSNLVFQMEYYTLTSTRSFKSHFILTTTFNGGALALIWLNSILGVLDPTIALLSILGFMTIASLLGMAMIRTVSDSRLKEAGNQEYKLRPAYHPWSFSRFEATNIHYFIVDICATIVPLLPVLLLERLVTLEDVGYFGFGISLYKATVVLATAVNIIYGPDLSVLYKTDGEKYVKYMDETISLTIFFQGLGVIGLAVLAEWVVSLLGSGRYGPSVLILRVLLTAQLFEGLSFASNSVLRTSENSRALLMANIITLVSAAILTTGLIYLLGIMGAALSYAAILAIQGISSMLMISIVADTLPKGALKNRFVPRVLFQTTIPGVLIGLGLFFGLLDNYLFLGVALAAFAILGHLLGVTRISKIKTFILRVLKK